MTTAEKLRAKMESSFPIPKDEFLKSICNCIEHRGSKSFICDRHITQTDKLAIRPCDEAAAIKIATEEGFRYHYEYNGYGVRKIVFTL